MNIGIVTTWFERGASYVSKQYRDILKDDFNTFIYARGGECYAKDDSNWNDKNVTWAKKIPLPVNMAIDKKDFIEWINNNKIEIILFNEQQWWLPIIWAKELGVTCGSYIDYYTEETIPLFQIFDFLLCNTKRHYNTFSWHENAYYIPWGTNIDIFTPKKYTAVNNKCITFFHSSGFSPSRKGTGLLLEAFNLVKGNKKLVIHTQVNLIQKLPKQRKIIEELLNNDELEIITKTVSAPGLYYLGDIYVYPSKLDGIGLTIAEAISCGLPTIVPDNAPMNEFITKDNGKTVCIDKFYSRADGYYWPQCDVSIEDLKNKMQYYLDNKDEIENYKRKAREYAENNLNWNNHKSEIITIFNKVKYNNYRDNLILEYENKKSSSHWARRLYIKYPILFNFMKFVYALIKRF